MVPSSLRRRPQTLQEDVVRHLFNPGLFSATGGLTEHFLSQSVPGRDCSLSPVEVISGKDEELLHASGALACELKTKHAKNVSSVGDWRFQAFGLSRSRGADEGTTRNESRTRAA